MKIIFKILEDENYKELFTINIKPPIIIKKSDYKDFFGDSGSTILYGNPIATVKEYKLFSENRFSHTYTEIISSNIDDLLTLIQLLRCYQEVNDIKIPVNLYKMLQEENLKLLVSVISEDEWFIKDHDYDLYYDTEDKVIDMGSTNFKPDIHICNEKGHDYYPTLSDFIETLQKFQKQLQDKYKDKKMYVKLHDPMLYYPDNGLVSDMINGVSAKQDEDGNLVIELGYDEIFHHFD